MDADYIADLEEEVRVLRGRVTELEAEVVEARENLNIALERKVEEVITIPLIPGFHLLGLCTMGFLTRLRFHWLATVDG